MNPLVTVTIVTQNSRRYVETCLAGVFSQTYSPLEVVIVDNASTDGTAEMLAGRDGIALVTRNPRNTGFAAAQNQAIASGSGEWVLTLNPDARLEPDFIERLVAVSRYGERVGVVCGKLLRANPDLTVPAERRIDSTGIYFTSNLRHFDRGWNEPDDGRYSQTEYVFGASAAAALYRREMIDDVSLPEGFFDPDFFAYREDADVAWRAQLLGWRCLYVPEALGYHVRRVVPEYRRHVPAVLRMHSVKNRLLMRINNMTGDLYRKVWLPTTLRDVVVLGGCLLREPASLPAFWYAARCLPQAWKKRRWIMRRREVVDGDLALWFNDIPESRKLETKADPAKRMTARVGAKPIEYVPRVPRSSL